MNQVETAVHRSRKEGIREAEMKKRVKELISHGAEGVVARSPLSLYFHGRSDLLVKIKAHKDQEGLVVSISEDHSTYTLRLTNEGIITAELQGGLQTRSLATKPSVGEVVTFVYNLVNLQGSPANASITRIRRELTWQDVLHSEPHEPSLNAQAETAVDKREQKKRKEAGYWTSNNNANVRLFLDNFARERGWDPRVPSNWTNVQGRDIIAAGGVGFIGHYGGSLAKCLVDIYQDSGFKITNRSKLPQRYWQDISNRKQVFDNFAKMKGFDPLIPKHWYYVPRIEICRTQGGNSVMDYYHGSMGNALKDVYPTVAFNDHVFFKKYWHAPANRRKFFDGYAETSGFDPLKVENWYKVTTESVTKFSGGYSVMEYYNSLLSAITENYPELEIDESKFSRLRCGYWTAKTKRKFFDEFAQEQGFDPLITDNWYKYSKADIVKKKGAYSVLRDYQGSLNRAIVDLYPGLHPDSTKFSSVPSRYWNSVDNQKNYLLRLTRERGLDPLQASTWDILDCTQIKKIPGGRGFLKATKGLEKALATSFPELQIRIHRHTKKMDTPSIWDRVNAQS